MAMMPLVSLLSLMLMMTVVIMAMLSIVVMMMVFMVLQLRLLIPAGPSTMVVIRSGSTVRVLRASAVVNVALFSMTTMLNILLNGFVISDCLLRSCRSGLGLDKVGELLLFRWLQYRCFLSNGLAAAQVQALKDINAYLRSVVLVVNSPPPSDHLVEG